MKKTAAISALDVQYIIEDIDQAIKDVTTYNERIDSYVSIIIKNNESMIAKFKKVGIEKYQKFIEEYYIENKDFMEKYFNRDLLYNLDIFDKNIVELNISQIAGKNQNLNIDQEKNTDILNDFEKKYLDMRNDLYSQYTYLINFNKEFEGRYHGIYHVSNIQIPSIIKYLNGMKNNLTEYLNVLNYSAKIFTVVKGEDSKKLREYLERYLQNFINSLIQKTSADIENVLDFNKEKLEKFIDNIKKETFLFLKYYKIEDPFKRSSNDPQYPKELKDDNANVLKEMFKIMNVTINTHLYEKLITKLQHIYSSFVGKLETMDNYGKSAIMPIINTELIKSEPPSLKSLTELEILANTMTLYNDLESDIPGKLSFKKVTRLSKMLQVDQKTAKRILSELVKKGYNYLIAHIYSQALSIENKLWDSAKIIFEKTYGRNVNSADDFIKYLEITTKLHNMNIDLDERLILLEYFENIQPNKKIKVEDLTNKLEIQIDRYESLDDMIHNNTNLEYDNYDYKKNIVKGLKSDLMRLAGNKKYSVPHKEIAEMATTLLGFEPTKEKENEDDEYELYTNKETGEERYRTVLKDPNEVYLKAANLVKQLKVLIPKYSGIASETLISFVKKIEQHMESKNNLKAIGKLINYWSEKILIHLDNEDLKTLEPFIENIIESADIIKDIKSLFKSKLKNVRKELEVTSIDIIKNAGFESKKQALDTINFLIEVFKNPAKHSFSKMKEYSILSKKIMFLLQIMSIKNGYEGLLKSKESLEDVENETGEKFNYNPEKDKKHPALYKLNVDINDNYRFRVLDADDPRHLTIGIESDCCQRLGGVGEAAAKDSFINPLAGILILESKNGEFVTQSYIHYVPNENGYILDNIEGMPDRWNEEEVKKAYIKLAEKMKEKGANYFSVGKEYSAVNFNKIVGNSERDEHPIYFTVEEPYSDFNENEYWELKDADYNSPEEIFISKEFDYKPFEKQLKQLKV